MRFAFVDITSSMVSLKSFLLLRDTSDAYKDIRGTKKVGVPVLVVDDVAHIIEDEASARALVDELHLAE